MPQLQKVTWEELIQPEKIPGLNMAGSRLRLDKEVWPRVLERLEDQEKWPDTEGIIVFQNLDMSSSHLGEQAVLPYGPGHTIQDIQPVLANPAGFRVGATSSVMKFPVYYVTREEHSAVAGPTEKAGDD